MNAYTTTQPRPYYRSHPVGPYGAQPAAQGAPATQGQWNQPAPATWTHGQAQAAPHPARSKTMSTPAMIFVGILAVLAIVGAILGAYLVAGDSRVELAMKNCGVSTDTTGVSVENGTYTLQSGDPGMPEGDQLLCVAALSGMPERDLESVYSMSDLSEGYSSTWDSYEAWWTVESGLLVLTITQN